MEVEKGDTKSVSSAPEEVEDVMKSEVRSNNSYTACMKSIVNCSSISGDDDYIKITNLYIFSLYLSPVLHVLDVGTDTYLAYQYCSHGEYTYFVATILFVAVPAIISTFFSIRMYVRDDERVSCWKWTFRCILLALQISPVIRYFEALQHALVLKRRGYNSREYKKHSALLKKEDSNLALLRILECFLEAAPQQVLQITILLTPGQPNISPVLQVYLYMSLLTSFLSTSWTFAMYHRSIRFAQKDKMKLKWMNTAVQFTWIFCIMTSRILAISEAASVYPRGTLLICLVHWFVMTTWLSVFEKTFFCSSPADESYSNVNKIKEVLFCVVMGLVYIFSFVAVNDKPTRYKFLFYYSVCFLENCLSIIAWLLESAYAQAWWFLLPPTIVFFVFALGIVMMAVYYLCYHPSMCHEAEDVMSLPDVAFSPSAEKKQYLDELSQTVANRSSGRR